MCHSVTNYMARLFVQCDQIGRFLQVLGNKLSHKSSQNILVTFWLFLIMSLLCKKCVATFWAIFGRKKLGNFLFHHLVTLVVTMKICPMEQYFANECSNCWQIKGFEISPNLVTLLTKFVELRYLTTKVLHVLGQNVPKPLGYFNMKNSTYHFSSP